MTVVSSPGLATEITEGTEGRKDGSVASVSSVARSRTDTPEMTELLHATTDDGLDLAVEHFPASGRARGAVWLGHAILANRRSLDRPRGGGLASELAAAGLHAYTIDLRGHGGSRAAVKGAGWRYEDLLRGDFPAVTRLVRERHRDLRLGAVGHSLAGHAAAAWLGTARGRPPVDALVTLGAHIWIRRLEPSALRWVQKRAVLDVMGGLARVFGRVPARAAGFGSEDAPAGFAAQWLGWAAANAWRYPEGEDYLASLARVTTPVLAVVGTGDRLLCHPVPGEIFHRHLRSAPLEIEVAAPPALGYDPGHMELVTDARSRPLWRRIAAWLVERLAA